MYVYIIYIIYNYDGYVYNYDRFLLLYGRDEHRIVKQLSSNLKRKNKNNNIFKKQYISLPRTHKIH